MEALHLSTWPDKLNNYYDMSNDNNVPVGLTDAKIMRLFDNDDDNKEQFSRFIPELGPYHSLNE